VGFVQHGSGRPLRGRKLHGKSERELRGCDRRAETSESPAALSSAAEQTIVMTARPQARPIVASRTFS
jgi:hypothetical protein